MVLARHWTGMSVSLSLPAKGFPPAHLLKADPLFYPGPHYMITHLLTSVAVLFDYYFYDFSFYDIKK